MRNAQSNWALKISTLIVVTACFVVMGSSLLVAQNFKNILTLWGEEVQLTVYLNPEITEAGRLFIENKLKETGKVGEIQLVTQEKALNDFRLQMASYAPEVTKDEELLRLIPASLQVHLASEIPTSEQNSALRSLAELARGIEGVEDVTYGQDWIEKYATFVIAIELILKLLGFVIVLAALFVVSNAIRASVQNRKDKIIVLEMIGATSAMIRKPFLYEGATLGLTSSVVAITLCYGLYAGLKTLIIQKLSFLQLGEHLQFMSPLLLILFIAGGAGLGALASYLCVRRLNDGYAGIQG